MRAMATPDTRTRLLDTAQGLVQRRGWNAFSFKDLAEAVGIRTASIHYHFPAKADLGLALVERYTADLDDALAEIERDTDVPAERLSRFIDLYRATEDEGLICLCGSLASDHATLPEELQQAVAGYLERSETWAAEQIRRGVEAGTLNPDESPDELAATLVGSLQGGLLIARTRPAASRIEAARRAFQRALGGD